MPGVDSNLSIPLISFMLPWSGYQYLIEVDFLKKGIKSSSAIFSLSEYEITAEIRSILVAAGIWWLANQPPESLAAISIIKGSPFLSKTRSPLIIPSLIPIAFASGALLIRGYERGERVYLSMISRGFNGNIDFKSRNYEVSKKFNFCVILSIVILLLDKILWLNI